MTRNEEPRSDKTSTMYEEEVPKSEGKLIVSNSSKGIVLVSIFAGALVCGAAVTAIHQKYQK